MNCTTSIWNYKSGIMEYWNKGRMGIEWCGLTLLSQKLSSEIFQYPTFQYSNIPIFPKTMQIDFNRIPSPCYVIDERLLRDNLELIKQVKEAARIEILVALRLFRIGVCFRSLRNTALGLPQARSMKRVWPLKNSG